MKIENNCKYCVNLLMHKSNVLHCDYEKFDNIEIKNINILTDENFKCIYFEDIRKL